MSANFIKRIVVSLVAVAALTAVIYYSHCAMCGFIFSLLLTGIVLAALDEFYQLVETKGVKPLKKIGMIGAAVYIGSLALATSYPSWALLPWVSLTFTLLAGFIYFFYHENQALLRLSVTFFGLLYLALPLGTFLLINSFFLNGDHLLQGQNDGRWWVGYILAMTKISDIGAFFFGKAFGSYRLAESISPKKTIEGAIAGLLTAIIVSMTFPIFAAWVSGISPITISWVDSLVLGFLVGILAPLGDLSESLLKRDAGVKHSSALPGLGGVLDVVDSLIFTTPLVYFYLLVTFR